MAWPILLSAVADFTQGPPNLPGTNAVALNPTVELKGFRTTRGRQYELGQAEAGTLDLTIDDPNEQLSPLNTGSTWNTSGNSLLPYRGVQVGAWLNPAATVSGGQLVGALAGNLLNTSNRIPGQPWCGYVYGYDPSFENWAINTQAPTGGMSVVTGLPASALNANTGFESGIAPWVTAGCTVTQSATQKHSGSFSAKVTPNGTSAIADMASELVSVVPGRQYTITGWVWVTTAVTGNFDVAVTWWDATSAALSSAGAASVSIPATTWTQVTGTFTAPPNAAFLQIHAQLTGTPSGSNIWYLDDVSVTNAAAPTDSAFPVSVVTLASSNDFLGWTPRFVPGQTYTFTIDMWVTSGQSVTLAFHAATNVTNTFTGTGAFVTKSITFTPLQSDVPLNPMIEIYSTSATTVYLAKPVITGLVAGYTSTGAGAMGYTPVFPSTGNQSLVITTQNSTDSIGLPLSTVPGQQYTFSAYVAIQNTGTALSATQTILGVASTATTVGGYQRISNTFTATVATTTVTWKAASTPYPAIAYIDNIQLELAAVASAVTTAGPVFNPLFTGWIERYPQQWSTMGRRGMRPLTGVDALSPLSRVVPNTNYAAVILADNPTAYLPLDDSSLPQIVEQPKGGFPFNGYTSIGTSGQVSFEGDTFLDGNPTVAVGQQNASPPISGNTAYITYLGTTNGSAPFNPLSVSLEFWLKFVSGTVYLGAAAVSPSENPNTEATGPNYWLGLYTDGGSLFSYYKDPNGGPSIVGPLGVGNRAYYPDNKWHCIALMLSGSNVYISVDGAPPGSAGLGFTPTAGLSINNFFIDTTTYFGDLLSQVSVTNMALYQGMLTNTQLSNHYQRGIGHLGEGDMARCLRMLNQYWSTAVLGGTNQATMSADFYYYTNSVATISTTAASQPSLLQDLQDITSTGDGFLWCDAYGIVHVDSRETRYTATQSSAPQFTFSDNPIDIAAGALVYTDLAYDYDPTYVYSQAQLTVDGTNDVVTVTNTTSATNYGQRILSKTMYMPDDWQTLQAANFYTQRYSAPAGAPGSTTPFRIASLKLAPATNPTLWQAALSLDVDDRITVTKKTSVGTVITGDYYIEQVSHSVDIATATWEVTYQLSPVWNSHAGIISDPTYGVLGSTTTVVY